MIVEDVELRVQPSSIFHGDPIDCDHIWEPLWGTDRACCASCRALARWIDTREQIQP
jgi:hypothetical protein